MNIYPVEVENALIEHPAVLDVAVFGIPNDDMGQEVKAAVELAPGVDPSPELAQELIEFCRARLARFKAPRSVDFHDALPRTDAGKLLKQKLREPYWSGRASYLL